MSSTDSRIAWPDAARGLAIVLVVLHHAVQYLEGVNAGSEHWLLFTEVLRTLRMPLFFMTAGLFSLKWIAGSWHDLLRSKILLLGWVYVLWVFLRWGWFNLLPGKNGETGLGNLLQHLVLPLGGWFLVALAVFFLMAKATARIPPRWQLGLAALLSLLWFSGFIDLENHAFNGIPQFYVFFLTGALCRSSIIDFAESRRYSLFLFILVAWVAACSAAVAAGVLDHAVAGFGLRCLGAVAGIAAAVLLQPLGWLRAVGRRTLPIYVSSSLFLAALALLFRNASFIHSPWFLLAAPLLISALAIFFSLALEWLARRFNARWLFANPGWTTALFDRSWTAVTGLAAPLRRVLYVGVLASGVLLLALAVFLGATRVHKTLPVTTEAAELHWTDPNPAARVDAQTVALYQGILRNSAVYAATVYVPQTLAYVDGSLRLKGKDAAAVRPAASSALALATALETGVLRDDRLTPEAARRTAIDLVDLLVAEHWSNKMLGGWGGKDSWQGAHWAQMTGMAAWLLWDDLSARQRAQVANMVQKEADRFIHQAPPYWRTPSGGKAAEGDTKAEEIAWNATALQLAQAMFPEHPHRAAWQKANTRYLLAAFARESDLRNATPYDGVPLHDWIKGWNIEENGTLYNHGILNPDYMATLAFSRLDALSAAMAGAPANPASAHNAELVYAGLTALDFGTPPHQQPGGRIYREDGSIYYPAGADQGTQRRMHFAALDLMMSVLSNDPAVRSTAADWAKLHAGTVAAFQSRFSDGRTYAETDDDLYYARESWVARYAAWSVLFIHATEQAQ